MARFRKYVVIGTCGILLHAACGCVDLAAKVVAARMIGNDVSDEETSQLGLSLVGQPAAAADAKLGPPEDVLHQVGNGETWRIYPVPTDALGNQRYVVRVSGGRITSVSKEQMDALGAEMAMKLHYDEKARGKTPREVERALGMGPPVVTVRSEKSGQLSQYYSAPSQAEPGGPKFCRVRYDASNHCSAVAMVDGGSSSGGSSAR